MWCFGVWHTREMRLESVSASCTSTASSWFWTGRSSLLYPRSWNRWWMSLSSSFLHQHPGTHAQTRTRTDAHHWILCGAQLSASRSCCNSRAHVITTAAVSVGMLPVKNTTAFVCLFLLSPAATSSKHTQVIAVTVFLNHKNDYIFMTYKCPKCDQKTQRSCLN